MTDKMLVRTAIGVGSTAIVALLLAMLHSKVQSDENARAAAEAETGRERDLIEQKGYQAFLDGKKSYDRPSIHSDAWAAGFARAEKAEIERREKRWQEERSKWQKPVPAFAAIEERSSSRGDFDRWYNLEAKLKESGFYYTASYQSRLRDATELGLLHEQLTDPEEKMVTLVLIDAALIEIERDKFHFVENDMRRSGVNSESHWISLYQTAARNSWVKPR